MAERVPRRRARPGSAGPERTPPERVGRPSSRHVEFAPEVIRAGVDPAPPDLVRRANALGGNAAALRAAHALGFAAGDLAADAYTGEEPPDLFFGALAELDAPLPAPPGEPPAARAGANLSVPASVAPGAGVTAAAATARGEAGEAEFESAADQDAAELVVPGAQAGPGETGGRPAGAMAPGRAGTDTTDSASPGTAPPANAVGPAAVDSPHALVTAVSTAAANLGTDRHTSGPPPDVAAGRAFPAALAAPITRPSAVRDQGGGGRRPAREDDLPPDPVPVATKAITTARAAELPGLPLPQLLTPPGGPAPVLTYPEGVAELKRPKPPEPEKPKGRRPKPKPASTERDAQTAAPQPVAPQPFVPPVLLDLRRPPIPVLDPKLKSAEQNKIRTVIALVQADLPSAAQPFVRQLRDTAGFGDLLGREYDDKALRAFWEPAVGDKVLLERLIEPMRVKLDELGEAAGVSALVLGQAVREKQQELVSSGRAVSERTRALVQQRGPVVVGDAEKQAAKEQARLAKEHARRLAQLRRAMTSRDPALVDQLADERVLIMNDQVAAGILTLESSAARRIELLEALTAVYLDAYQAADDAAQAAARARAVTAAGPEPPPSIVQVPRAEDGRPWLLWAREQVVASMKALRAQTNADRDTRIAALRAAGTAGAAAVREWADKRLRRNASQQKREAQTVADREAADKRLENARKQAAKDKARDDVVAQIRYAEAFHAARQAEAAGSATQAQKAMLAEAGKAADAYLGSAEVPGDPLSAVAHHLAEQVGSQTVAALTESGEINAKVKELRARTPEQAISLGNVIFPSRSPDAADRAKSLWSATGGQWGTDEGAVFAALENLDQQQVDTIGVIFQAAHNETLYDRLDSELSGSEWDRAEALLRSDQVGAVAAAIRYETNSLFSAPDRGKIAEAVKTLPPGRADDLRDRFGESARWYNASGTSLDEVLGKSMRTYRYDQRTGKSTTDDRSSEQIGLLIQVNMLKGQPQPKQAPGAGNQPASKAKTVPSIIDSQDVQNQVDALQAKADAIELDLALRPAYGPARADAMDAVFSRMRAEIAGENPAWTVERVNNEVRRRNANVERSYGQQFPAAVQTNNLGLPVTGLRPEDSRLRQVMAANLYGSGEKEIGAAMLDVDRRAERVARILLADRGAYAADSDVNAGLETSYTQATDEVRRAEGPRLQQERSDKIRRAQEAGRPLTPDQLAAEDRKADRELEGLIKKRAKELMAETRTDFAKTGRGSLEDWVTDKTQFSGEKEAMWRLQGGGGLSRAQQMWLAVDGWGHDTEQAKKAMAGRTPDEIAEIDKEFTAISNDNRTWPWQPENESMAQRLHRETSGEDRFDLDEALLGEPLTAADRMASLTRRYEYNKKTYFGGSGPPASLAGSMRMLDIQYQATKRAYERLADPGSTLTVEDRNYLQRSFEAQATRTQTRAQDYREAVHAYTDEWVQIISTAVAVVVGGALAIVTGGAALPLIALAASLWATAATMVVKLVLLGEAYGVHEYIDDLVVGAVDAAFAFATAGLGDKLLGVAKVSGADKAAIRLAAAAARAQRAAKPAIARMGTALLENVGGAAPSALAGNLVNRENWRGDMFANIAKGTFAQIGTGLVVGGAVGHSLEMGGRIFGAIAGPALERFKAWRGAAAVPEGAFNAAGAAEHQHVPGVPAGGEPTRVTERVEAGTTREGHPDVAGARESAAVPDRPAGGETQREPGPAAVLSAPAADAEGTRAPAAESERARGQADVAAGPAAEPVGPAATTPVDAPRTGAYAAATDAAGAPLARIETHPDAVHQQQRSMRREVLADLPPRERAAYAGTPILVLSDADYTARTGSAEKGMATVLIIGGKPVVVIREGAPLWALREEGRHLKQLADPIHAEHVRLLDEGRQTDWKNLPLPERMLSAQAHLELEIEMQRDLIADLSHQKLAGSGDPHLDVRLDTAQRAHEALTGRLAELDSFRASPEGSPPPAFLAEPSRLNTKKTTPKPPANAPPDPAAVPTPAEAAAAAAAVATAEADLAAARVRREQAPKERAALGADLKRVSDLYDRVIQLEGEIFRSRDAETRAALDVRRRQLLADFHAAYPDAGRNLTFPKGVDAKNPDVVARHALASARDLLRGASLELTDTMRRLDHLLSGSKLDRQLPTAGAGRDVLSQGGERHHMPSTEAILAASKLPHLPESALLSGEGGGVIRLDTEDHRMTASHGSSKKAEQHRADQIAWISEGRYLEAVEMDIVDIRSNPVLRVKYEKDIQAFVDFLIRNRKDVKKLSPKSGITIESLRTVTVATPRPGG